MIYGTGIDIIETQRLERAVRRWGDRFLSRLYTRRELQLARSGRSFYQSLAGKFAAKEAVLKALGTGLRSGRWVDIEVVPDRFGKPEVVFSGRFRDLVVRLGVQQVLVSVSHSRDYAVATALVLAPKREDGPEGCRE